MCKIFNIKKCGYTCPGNLLHALVILGHFFTVKDFQATHLKPSKATNRLRFSLCDFPLHLPLELLGVDLTLQVDNPSDGETLKDEIDAAGTVCNIWVILESVYRYPPPGNQPDPAGVQGGAAVPGHQLAHPLRARPHQPHLPPPVHVPSHTNSSILHAGPHHHHHCNHHQCRSKFQGAEQLLLAPTPYIIGLPSSFLRKRPNT